MIGQIRYYGKGSEDNSDFVSTVSSYDNSSSIPGIPGYNAPTINQSQSTSAEENLRVGNTFFNGKNVTQVIIQSLPGIHFRINGQPQNPYWSQLGPTGIFELKLDNLMKINQLEIKQEDLDLIGSMPSSYIIVDYIYEGGNM